MSGLLVLDVLSGGGCIRSLASASPSLSAVPYQSQDKVDKADLDKVHTPRVVGGKRVGRIGYHGRYGIG